MYSFLICQNWFLFKRTRQKIFLSPSYSSKYVFTVTFIYRYLVRRQLIESGMIEWLIDHLKQFLNKKSNLSCYGLEYSTALFMNLCLHRSGKLRCLPMAQEVLSTFLDLLSSTNKRQVVYAMGLKTFEVLFEFLFSNTRIFLNPDLYQKFI